MGGGDGAILSPPRAFLLFSLQNRFFLRQIELDMQFT